MVSNIKAETLKHYSLKFLINKRLHELQHKAVIEFEFEGIGVIDVLDYTTGLAYEVTESRVSNSVINDKTERYLRISGIRDVIFINGHDYSIDWPLTIIYKKLCEVLV